MKSWWTSALIVIAAFVASAAPAGAQSGALKVTSFPSGARVAN